MYLDGSEAQVAPSNRISKPSTAGRAIKGSGIRFMFRVANVTKPIADLFFGSAMTVLQEDGRCYIVTPSATLSRALLVVG